VIIKSPAISLALIAGSAIMPSFARAQAPQITSVSNVWTPPGLDFNDCMRRAVTAINQAGSTNVKQQTVFSGTGYTAANVGDYCATVMKRGNLRRRVGCVALTLTDTAQSGRKVCYEKEPDEPHIQPAHGIADRGAFLFPRQHRIDHDLQRAVAFEKTDAAWVSIRWT
jgi:hypothetical protein